MAAFSQARAPGIYKGEYLKELFRRYGDEEDTPPPPELPEWCFEEDNDGEVDDDGNAVGQESGPSSSGSTSGKRKKEKLKLVRLPGSTRKWTVKWRIRLPLNPPPPARQHHMERFRVYTGRRFLPESRISNTAAYNNPVI